MCRLGVGLSENGRYFVDKENNPKFWLGDTQWNLFRSHTLEEAELIIKSCGDKGFTFIQVMLMGTWKILMTTPVICGEAFPDNNPASPNIEYFKHVDSIVDLALQNGIVLVIGLDHPRIRLVNMDNARTFGRWMGERYKNYPNIIWVASYSTPNSPWYFSDEFNWVETSSIPDFKNDPVVQEIAYGLKEGDGGSHLITCHPDPAIPVATSGSVHNEDWLDFNCIQTFSSIDLIYDTVTTDYKRSPSKPVVMAEGAYEDGPEYGMVITPHLVRKQAYLCYFAGGYHSYGHNDNWRVTSTWKASLNSPGAQQMKVLRNVFEAHRWWELVPDQTIFGSGVNEGHISNAAMRTPAGDLIMIYSSSTAAFSINMDQITASESVTAAWIDPRNGNTVAAGSFPTNGLRIFICPSGWQDSLLILEAIKKMTGATAGCISSRP